MTVHQRNLSRRSLLQGAAGLVIAFHLPREANAQSGAASIFRPDGNTGVFAPNAFIRIGTDNTVTILSKHIEFGQGPFTGLATIVAEELDADWSQMRAEHAPADAALITTPHSARCRAPAARPRFPIPTISCVRRARPRARC